MLVCIHKALIQFKVPPSLNHLRGKTNIGPKNEWSYLKNNNSFYGPNIVCKYFLHCMNLLYKDNE